MGKLADTLSLIKFSHTLFALPFALASMLVAANGLPPLRIILLILACMVTARTAGMAFNRYLDAEIDARNPRTATREIPRGVISRRFALSLSVISALLFVLSAAAINPLCLRLSPIALFFVFFYSYTKRFTPLAHLFVGIALGLAPIGAWIATTGEFGLESLILGIGVLFWVAGFDIIYATLDSEFDKKEGLHSVVVALGIKKALLVSRLFHVITFLGFSLFGILIEASWSYWFALAICLFLLVYEHTLVKPNDLSKVNAAFFNMNGYVSVVFLAGVIISVF
ncbi:MAG: UbiA family prenyltransferase [Deltaproteobacteria bacterium]|nr:UbiA family prenyltransferase [Deltaproteobacteria bacterium]